MIVTLLSEYHLAFLSFKGGSKARLSLHLSKRQIVGNHMHWLKMYLKRIQGHLEAYFKNQW